MEIIDNIFTITCDNDTQNLKKYCMFLNGYIKKYFFDKDKDKNDFNKEFPITGYLHYKYNIFTFPNPFIYQLFLDIQSMFLKITKNNNDTNTKYYIRGWLNYYKTNGFIDWHYHSPIEHNAWHGFFCVDCGESYTEYTAENITVNDEKNIDNNNSTIIHSKTNLLAIGKANRYHRSSKRKDNNIRITIAFDIVPAHILFKDVTQLQKNWIPL